MAEDTVKKPEDEAKKEREKKAVEARLAQSPVVSKGSVKTADGTQLGYLATCEYLPVVKHAFGNERGEPISLTVPEDDDSLDIPTFLRKQAD